MRLLTRRLLRDWKHYNRVQSSGGSRYRLRPHDSNLHVWHLVMQGLDEREEIYALLYLKELASDDNCVIILKCMTPNGVFPLHRNVSLTHLQQLLVQEHGFLKLIEHISILIFSNKDSFRYSGRLCYAWNRIMCKDFLRVFPELHGCLQQGDFQLVKKYSARNGTGSNVAHTQNIEYMEIGNYFGTDSASDFPSMATNNSLIACDSNVNGYKHSITDEPSEQNDRTKKRKL